MCVGVVVAWPSLTFYIHTLVCLGIMAFSVDTRPLSSFAVQDVLVTLDAFTTANWQPYPPNWGLDRIDEMLLVASDKPGFDYAYKFDQTGKGTLYRCACWIVVVVGRRRCIRWYILDSSTCYLARYVTTRRTHTSSKISRSVPFLDTFIDCFTFARTHTQRRQGLCGGHWHSLGPRRVRQRSGKCPVADQLWL